MQSSSSRHNSAIATHRTTDARTRLIAVCGLGLAFGLASERACGQGGLIVFQQRVEAGNPQYLGVPANPLPTQFAELTWSPGTPGGIPVTDIMSTPADASWWRWAVKGAATVLGGVGGALAAGAAAAPATGGLGAVPAAYCGAGACAALPPPRRPHCSATCPKNKAARRRKTNRCTRP